MSMAVSLLALVRQEMEKCGASRLVSVTVRYGALANVVPESLAMAFEVTAQGTPFEQAAIIMEEEPISLACGACQKTFMPESSKAALFSPCPACGEEFGHTVLAGKSLYLAQIEVE